MKRKLLTPVSVPILYFGLLVLIGTILLSLPVSQAKKPISFLDALFTSVSASCVTGLIVVDTGSFFSYFGQWVILVLIQLGGVGIMTYTSLMFYLLKKRVSVSDRAFLQQSLLHNPFFNLKRFLIQLFLCIFVIEIAGAMLIHVFSPKEFQGFSALFHSVSAFCNAGFSLSANSLIPLQSHVFLNVIFMLLIILGGLGFSVLIEIGQKIKALYQSKSFLISRVNWHTKIVLKTSSFLILVGWGVMFFSEQMSGRSIFSWNQMSLMTLFQSVTARTAGFNTMNINQMTNVSLLMLIFLMVIGGSSGSCAGGIKTSTFRTLVAFILSQMRGRKQTVIGYTAVEETHVNKAFTLFIAYITTLVVATLLLSFTEGGNLPHLEVRGKFMELSFEAVSALGTVGLSTGVTSTLSSLGKIIIIVLMFVGRLGPILFIAALQSWQYPPRYRWPEQSLMIG